jgi:hypothetical protein
MSGAATLAGDFALLFRGHRSKSAAFLAHSVHSFLPRYLQQPGGSSPHANRLRDSVGTRRLQGGCQPGRKGETTKWLYSRRLHEWLDRIGSWPDVDPYS